MGAQSALIIVIGAHLFRAFFLRTIQDAGYVQQSTQVLDLLTLDALSFPTCHLDA